MLFVGMGLRPKPRNMSPLRGAKGEARPDRLVLTLKGSAIQTEGEALGANNDSHQA